jgi:hypothetical protein
MDDLAGAKPTAITEGEHHLIPEAVRHGKQPLCLVGAHGQRQLLLLLEVVDLGRQIVPPQRDAEWIGESSSCFLAEQLACCGSQRTRSSRLCASVR